MNAVRSGCGGRVRRQRLLSHWGGLAWEVAIVDRHPYRVGWRHDRLLPHQLEAAEAAIFEG